MFLVLHVLFAFMAYMIYIWLSTLAIGLWLSWSTTYETDTFSESSLFFCSCRDVRAQKPSSTSEKPVFLYMKNGHIFVP